MPTAAERYDFANVERDGKNFISDMFEQCKVYSIGNISNDNLMKLGTKDTIAK